ncbi:MAG: sulfotransferase family 2 domain-containing protein [Verrucomicrobia bacterium]|jgi:hypothetical protein|nr:sulfotransferase family 2 domain-containing protein [Verrucomicrobiota bacterium]
MNFANYLPPISERRGRFEKLRPARYKMTSFLKHYNSLKQKKKPDAVFLWIPRTGGTSFFKALEKYGCLKLRRLDQIHYHFPQTGLVTFSHCHYPTLLRDGFVSPGFNQRAFKFAVARNPYDRIVSLYHYFVKLGDIHPKTSFRLFCQLLKEDAIDKLGLFNVNGMSQCQPQVNWLKDTHEKLIPDYIGRYETLAVSFSEIMTSLGLRAEMPHVNQTEHKPYLEYYDRELLDIVGDYYAEDFECFNYERL